MNRVLDTCGERAAPSALGIKECLTKKVWGEAVSPKMPFQALRSEQSSSGSEENMEPREADTLECPLEAPRGRSVDTTAHYLLLTLILPYIKLVNMARFSYTQPIAYRYIQIIAVINMITDNVFLKRTRRLVLSDHLSPLLSCLG